MHVLTVFFFFLIGFLILFYNLKQKTKKQPFNKNIRVNSTNIP